MPGHFDACCDTRNVQKFWTEFWHCNFSMQGKESRWQKSVSPLFGTIASVTSKFSQAYSSQKFEQNSHWLNVVFPWCLKSGMGTLHKARILAHLLSPKLLSPKDELPLLLSQILMSKESHDPQLSQRGDLMTSASRYPSTVYEHSWSLWKMSTFTPSSAFLFKRHAWSVVSFMCVPSPCSLCPLLCSGQYLNAFLQCSTSWIFWGNVLSWLFLLCALHISPAQCTPGTELWCCLSILSCLTLWAWALTVLPNMVQEECAEQDLVSSLSMNGVSAESLTLVYAEKGSEAQRMWNTARKEHDRARCPWCFRCRVIGALWVSLKRCRV